MTNTLKQDIIQFVKIQIIPLIVLITMSIGAFMLIFNFAIWQITDGYTKTVVQSDYMANIPSSGVTTIECRKPQQQTMVITIKPGTTSIPPLICKELR